MAENERYADWRSLELAIKDAAKKAAQHAGPGVSAASVDAKIRQARFDRFLSRVFAHGERSEWLLKGGMSMLARVSRSRTTKDVDLAAQQAPNLAEAERDLTELVGVELGDLAIDGTYPAIAGGRPNLDRRLIFPATLIQVGCEMRHVTPALACPLVASCLPS